MRLSHLTLPLLAGLLGTVVACRSSSTEEETPYEPTPAEVGVNAAESPSSGTFSEMDEEEPQDTAVDTVAGMPSVDESADGPVPVEAGFGSQESSFIRDESERLQLEQERQTFLAEQYIARGDELLDRADLQGALEAYAQALEVNPSSADARAKLRRVEALMGDAFASAGDLVEDSVDREIVRRAQARIAAEQATLDGDSALREGEFDGALRQYREALLILQYHPLIATESLDEQLVRGKIAEATRLQEENLRDEAERRAADARQAQLAEEQRQARYREDKLRRLYDEANAAFVAQNYSKAESLVNQILLEDPGNEVALKFKGIAQSARHRKQDQVTRRNYREQWVRTFLELDTMDVPQTDAIVFDDLERWREVSMRQPLAFSAADPLADADRQAVLDRLGSVPITPRFLGPDGEGSPLEEVASFLQNLTGVNFLISSTVRDELDEEETTIKLELPERSVLKVLDIIAETSESLRWKIENGAVRFVTAEELVGGQVLQMYEVRDIIHAIPDFPGREINVSPSGGLEPPDEDFEEREGLVVTADQLDALIRDNIATESWDLDPANSLRITDSGTLVVNQTPEVQVMIQHLLDDLRESTGIMVDIQTRFLNVEDNFLEDIGVDFRGLGQPGLGTNAFLDDFGDPATQLVLGREIGQDTSLGAFFDDGGDGDARARIENLYDIQLGDTDVITGAGGLSFQWTYLNDLQLEMVLRAVSKSERVELVTAPRLLVFNTARSNVTVLNQVAYVSDFDVEIAQAASIADPIISVIQDGVILDVRPVVSADRRFIMMELRPTVAALRRPIDERSTSLGSQNSVTIQLPEVDIQRVRTTVPMPDRGTVLLGGLKVSEKKDLRSGVPVLNKIPVLSFLFGRKGQYTSNRKLLILLRAEIVIPSEREPTQAQLGM